MLLGPGEFDSTWYFSVLVVDFVPTGCFFAMLATAAMSVIFMSGLVGVSIHNNFVLLETAFSI